MGSQHARQNHEKRFLRVLVSDEEEHEPFDAHQQPRDVQNDGRRALRSRGSDRARDSRSKQLLPKYTPKPPAPTRRSKHVK